MHISDLLSIDTSRLLGKDWSVTEKDLAAYGEKIGGAAGKMDKLRRDGIGPDGSAVLFPHLPYLLEENRLIDEEEKEALLHLGETGKAQDVLISIGIGGSYLGNQVLLIFSAEPTGMNGPGRSGAVIRRCTLPERIWIRQN